MTDEPATTHWAVSADHVAPDWRFADYPVEVRPDNQGDGSFRYYAKAARLGCSRSYTTPARAIQALFHDHACTNIRIRAVD